MADEIKAVPAEGSNDSLVGAQKGAPLQSGAPSSVPEVTYVTAKDVGLILHNKHSAPPPPLTPAQPATPPAPPAPAPETFLAPVRSAPTPTKGNPLAPMSTEMPADDSAPDEKSANVQDDIARILGTVQIPERRAQKKEDEPKQYDTALAGSERAEEGALGAVHTMPQKTPETGPAPEADTVQAVHTLKQDLQGVVREQKISRVRAVALEEQKRRPEPIEPAPPKRAGRARNIIFVSLLLLFLGATALGGVYYVMRERLGTPSLPQSDSLVFAERSFVYDLRNKTPLAVKQALAGARVSTGASLGSITRIVPIMSTENAETPTERPATLREFLAALGTAPPDSLLRSLSDEFFFGFHTVDEEAPLLVVPVADYALAFAGMLEWERTINGDLAPVFSGVPTLTEGTDDIPVTRVFSDVVMRNYDVRALYDDSGTIQLYYSFPTRGLLVLAESPYSFTEILSRLQAERRL